MPIRYGILITEENLDLIEYLNGGVRPLIEKETTYYIFEMNPDNTDTQNAEIKSENDLYQPNGHLRKDLTLLF